MGTWEGLILAVGWLLVRFGLPIALTIIVCRLFKQLDARWRAEGEAYRNETGIAFNIPTVRCWLFNECSEEQRSKCKAYQDQSIPCWQHFRKTNGELKQECIGCGVFKGLPKPAIGD
jgi:hypothetical protein